MSGEKPRVAFLSPLLRGRGGWPTATAGIVHSLSRYVDPVLVVAQEDAAAAVKLLPGIETHILPALQPMVYGSLRVIWHMLPTLLAVENLPRLRVDLVHSLEMFPTGWAGERIANREGAPHVLTAFGTYGVIWHRWPLAAWIYGNVLQRAEYICPMSDGTADRMREHFLRDLKKTRLEVVYQGSEFARKVPAEAAELKVIPPAPVVLSVGAIKNRKGYRQCLRAFSLLQQRFPGAEYRIAGGGLGTPYHRELEEIINRENIRNVKFLGEQTWEEMDTHYRQASMLVMVSQEEEDIFEGFVFVFLEAGSYGLPVIGSRTGGIPDAVREGETGFLFPPEYIEQIAGGMMQLAEDPDLARRMGLAGRRRAEALTWERYAAQQYEVYQKVWGMRR